MAEKTMDFSTLIENVATCVFNLPAAVKTGIFNCRNGRYEEIQTLVMLMAPRLILHSARGSAPPIQAV